VKLSPSTESLPLGAKLADAAALLRYHRDCRRLAPEPVRVWSDLDEYAELLERHAGMALRDARVLEVGYGARPWRMLALLASGVDAIGVDAEVPVLAGRPSEYREAVRRNGVERAAKSLARRALFDRREWQAFRAELAKRGLPERLEPERFLVSDAAELELPADSLDLVTSEDVFEHVRRSSLTALVPKLARWLRPGGLALIRPNVFTGITGGHHPEWYAYTLSGPPRRRRTDPWEHLRRDRRRPNTSLNRLSRADYRRLFRESFEILEERVAQPDLGREWLTPELAAELSAYGEDELFSNRVLFVMRPLAR
jgi:Methyltransferase domain